MRPVSAKLLALSLCLAVPLLADAKVRIFEPRLRFVRDDDGLRIVLVLDQAANVHATLSPDGRELRFVCPGLPDISLPTRLPVGVDSVDSQPTGGTSVTAVVRFDRPIRLASQQVLPADGKLRARFLATIGTGSGARAELTSVATGAVLGRLDPPTRSPAPATPEPARPGALVLGLEPLSVGLDRDAVDHAIDRDFGSTAPLVRIASQDDGRLRNLYTVRIAIADYGPGRLVYDFAPDTDRLKGVTIDWGESGSALTEVQAGALASRLLNRLRDDGYRLRAVTDAHAGDASIEQAWDALLPDGSLLALALRRSGGRDADGYGIRLTVGN